MTTNRNVVEVRAIRRTLAAGAVYVAAIFFGEPIQLYVFRVPLHAAFADLPTVALSQQLVSLALRMPAALIIAVELCSIPAGPLRTALRLPSLRTVAMASAATIAISVFLNAIDVWPFDWRWTTDQSGVYTRALFTLHLWVAFVFWGVNLVVVTPVLEEIVFRFGVLRYLRAVTSSSATAVVGSSLLFAALHLGHWPAQFADNQHLVNAAGVGAGSLALAHITLRHDGRIGIAMISHASRNALIFGLLAWFFN